MLPTSSGDPSLRAIAPWIPIPRRRRTRRLAGTHPPLRKGAGEVSGGRRDTNDGDRDGSPPQYHIPREARKRTRGAGLRQRQDAEELHPHSPGGPGGGGLVALRPHAGTDYVPVQIRRRPEEASLLDVFPGRRLILS